MRWGTRLNQIYMNQKVKHSRTSMKNFLQSKVNLQQNFYVNAADELLKGEDDNPSTGLLICRSRNKTIAEWSLKGISNPLGVATYQLQQIVENTIEEQDSKEK